jgi:hypothetical protein
MFPNEITGARVNVAGHAANAVKIAGGVVVGVDIPLSSAGAARSTSALEAGVYMVTTSNYAHVAFGGSLVDATGDDALLAPGERCLIIPEGGSYVSLLGIGDSATDSGIARFARVT